MWDPAVVAQIEADPDRVWSHDELARRERERRTPVHDDTGRRQRTVEVDGEAVGQNAGGSHGGL